MLNYKADKYKLIRAISKTKMETFGTNLTYHGNTILQLLGFTEMKLRESEYAIIAIQYIEILEQFYESQRNTKAP